MCYAMRCHAGDCNVTLSLEGDDACAIDFDAVDEDDATVGLFYESRASADRPFRRMAITSGGGGGGQSRRARLRQRMRLMKQEHEEKLAGEWRQQWWWGKGKGKKATGGGRGKSRCNKAGWKRGANRSRPNSLLGGGCFPLASQ